MSLLVLYAERRALTSDYDIGPSCFLALTLLKRVCLIKDFGYHRNR